MARKATLIVCTALLLATAQAFPHLWVEKKAPSCTAVPTKGYDCHKAPVEDKASSITVTDGTGKAVTTVCAGQSYTVGVTFPDARYSFVTSNGGKVAVQNAVNQKCPTTMTFSKKTGLEGPTKTVSGKATAPAAGSWDITVASASGACAPFQITKASVTVGKC